MLNAFSAASDGVMRLRDDPQQQVNPPPAARNSRKRKSPSDQQQTQAPPAPPPQQQLQHILTPQHTMMHPLSAAFQYNPEFAAATAAALQATVNGGGEDHQSPSPSDGQTSGGRALSTSKRAEQNRKAQRAFRERRDQHVKHLESRSQLLDAALASADEANRRWEECRVLVDQLRVENAALRATLSQAQAQNLLPPTLSGPDDGKTSQDSDGNDANRE